jgi:hypothetical protein
VGGNKVLYVSLPVSAFTAATVPRTSIAQKI